MKRLLIGFSLLASVIVAATLVVPRNASGQAKGFNFYDTTQYPNAIPTSTGIVLWRNGSTSNTATFGGLMGAGLDITGNPVRVVGSGKNTIFASVAATSDKTMTFPNVTGNVVSTGDTGTVTNTMLAGSIAASKLVGTDIATVGTITSGTWTGTPVAVANGGTGATTAATARNNLGIINTVAPTRLTANVANATATMSNLTDLTQTGLVSGTNYVGELVVKCNNSQATEGIKFDLGGGSATASSFWAGGGVLASGGTDTIGTNIATSLTGVISFSVLTGETVLSIKFSFVCNGSGTFIPRFAENSTALGTATAELGTYLTIQPSSN